MVPIPTTFVWTLQADYRLMLFAFERIIQEGEWAAIVGDFPGPIKPTIEEAKARLAELMAVARAMRRGVM
ncbi:hypothetical protein LTR85_003920 [Meristemomyces frigidus]|nr:hypothetical protein LTR85_003920 [Meristemomyces frigidus]